MHARIAAVEFLFIGMNFTNFFPRKLGVSAPACTLSY